MGFDKTVCACAPSEKSGTLGYTTPGSKPLIWSLPAGFPAFLLVYQRARVQGLTQGKNREKPALSPSQFGSGLPHPFPSPLPSRPTNFSGYWKNLMMRTQDVSTAHESSQRAAAALSGNWKGA